MKTYVQESPSASSVNALIFSGGEGLADNDTFREAWTCESQTARPPSTPGPSNMQAKEGGTEARKSFVNAYVQTFEDMLCTVLQGDGHLFNAEEVELLAAFSNLSCNARFLMVKLLLRKQDAWHRLDGLKYHDEVGGTAGLVATMEELCWGGPESLNHPEEQDKNVADVTLDNKFESAMTTEEVQLPTPPGPVQTSARAAAKGLGSVPLAQSETDMDLQTMLSCLRLDELKVVAKQMQIKLAQKKEDLIAAMLHASASQTTLDFAQTSESSKSKHDGYRQTKLPFMKSPPKTQKERLREIALQSLVKCIRINTRFCEVIWRANLVFFRLTQYSPNLLVDALLSRFKKRHYQAYEHVRTSNIWATRQALLEYEEALILEGRVDSYLGGSVPAGQRAAASKTPVATSPLPPPETPGGSKKEAKIMRYLNEGYVDVDVKPDSVRVRGARLVKEIFERIYPRWQVLVMTTGEEDERKNGLERFHCGHVLTRIICKGSSALGVLKEYHRELEVLEALLAQKRWRRGRRGRWYERRVSVLCTHFGKDQETTERALVAVVEALEDPDTHICYRPKLQRRLVKLENALKLAPENRHTCEGKLAAAEEVVLEAERVRHRAASINLDRLGRNMNSKAAIRNYDIRQFTASPTKSELYERHVSVSSTSKSLSYEQKGKTIWIGQNGEELDVEALALQRYANQGYKGVHCETRVLTMLFGLLFWDIIFAQIPGAFETPYQTAPLDIAEDSFYYSRRNLIEKRLAEIENGEAPDIIREVDSVHRASATWCVGVRWDLFSHQDLVDIVTCIGGKALSVVCRVLCEDYVGRTSGGPDLFLWNPEKRVCKFVEVKGPGDTLQENQRVWIDVLLRAPSPVEICRVVERGSDANKHGSSRTRKRKKLAESTIFPEAGSVSADDSQEVETVLTPSGTSAATVTKPCSPARIATPTSSSVNFAPTRPLKRKCTPPNMAGVVIITPPRKKPKILKPQQ